MQMKRAKSYNVKKLNPKWFGTLFTFDHRLKGQHKTNCLQLTFPSRFIYIGNKQARKHHAGLQIMTCRWLKHRYLPYTYVSPEKKLNQGREGGRGSYQSCVGQKQVRTSVLLSFKKIMKKETLNPRFFFHVNFRKVYTLLYQDN